MGREVVVIILFALNGCPFCLPFVDPLILSSESWLLNCWEGLRLGTGVAKSSGVTKDEEGVEKNIPEAPVISFIGLNPILSFSGRPCEFGVGLPDPDKSEFP